MSLSDELRKDVTNCAKLLLGIGRQLKQSRDLQNERLTPDNTERVNMYSIIAERLNLEKRPR